MRSGGLDLLPTKRFVAAAKSEREHLQIFPPQEKKEAIFQTALINSNAFKVPGYCFEVSHPSTLLALAFEV